MTQGGLCKACLLHARETADQSTKSTASRRVPVALWLCLLAGIALAFYASSLQEDPGEYHYQKAQEMVTNFEMGRQPASINYDHPVYQSALGELGLVPSESRYAEKAAELAAQIRAKIDAFHRRSENIEAARGKKQEQTLARRQTFLENQRRQRLEPKRSYPECESDGAPASQ